MYLLTSLAVLCSAFGFSYVKCNPITPCKITDEKCLENIGIQSLSKFVTGDPELGMENLDPMHHDVIEGNLSTLKFKMTNSTVLGFKDCKTDNVKLNVAFNSLHADLICPKLVMTGKYEIQGRLSVLAIEGNGDYKIDTNKYRISIEANFDLVPDKESKTHLSVKSYRVTAEPLESVHFDFKNLFNGQQDLVDPVLKYANENWYEVTKELQDPIIKAHAKKLVKNANKYFKKLPLEAFLAL